MNIRAFFSGIWRKRKGIERRPGMELHVPGSKAELSFCFPAHGHSQIPLLHAKTESHNAIMIDPGRNAARVLFAVHSPRDPDTAVYKNTRDRAAFLEIQGCHCTVVTPLDFPWVRRFGARFTPLTYPVALAWWLLHRADNFDVAIFHSYAGWAVLRLARLLPRFKRLRTVIQFHGLEPLYYTRLQAEAEREGRSLSWRYRLVSGWLMLKLLRSACRRADLLLCLNSEEKRFLVEHGWTSPERVRLVSNPAPNNFFIRREYRKRATKLLFVGQWLNMKGTHCLVETFSKLRRQNPDLELICAGTLADADSVRRDFPQDVRPGVSIFPRVSRSELLDLHREADLFLFPTLSEGFSLALVEAMASGLPVVTTAVGASPDILQEGESVVFCPANDAEAFAAAVANLMHDSTRREQLGRNAQRAAENLRPENVWGDYSLALRQLLQRQDRQHQQIAVAAPTEGD